jgi:ketosteroid isomerase-like protein
MRYLVLTFLIIQSLFCYSQDKETITEIRRLEELERTAALNKDSSTLLKLWASDFTVNAPSNRVVTGGKSTLDRPVITQANYTSFEREVEHIILKGEIAICMGNETVVTTATPSQPSTTIKRRYSNIWMKEKEGWKLIARHANVICQGKP